MVLEVDIRVDMSLLDPLPDNTGHLVSIQVNHWRRNDNLARKASLENLFRQHFIYNKS